MMVLESDTFDTGDLSQWTFEGFGWALVPDPNGGQALQVFNSGAPAVLKEGIYYDAAAQVKANVQYGTAQLNLRVSPVGAYSVTLDANGQVTLYRAGTVLQSTLVSPVNRDGWRTLRLSAVGDVIRVAVDDLEVLTYQDPAPLPPGSVSFNGVFAPVTDNDKAVPPQNTLQVDDFILSAPQTIPSSGDEVGSITGFSGEEVTSAFDSGNVAGLESTLDQTLTFLENFEGQPLPPDHAAPVLEMTGIPTLLVGSTSPALPSKVVKARLGNGQTSVISLVIDFRLGEDETVTYRVKDLTWKIGFRYNDQFFPQLYGDHHQAYAELKDGSGQVLYTTPVCDYFVQQGGNYSNLCPPTTNNLDINIAGVRSVTFNYTTLGEVTSSFNTSPFVPYKDLVMDDLKVVTDQVTTMPTSPCGVAYALGVYPNRSTLRDFPSASTGVPIQSLPYNTEVTLEGKSWNVSENLWWWLVSLNDTVATQGWIREDVVGGDNPEACANIIDPPFRIPPPPPPGVCEVELKNDPNISYVVYAESRIGWYLVTPLNQLPQQWIDPSLVNIVSQDFRACDSGVLGVVKDLPETTEQSYVDSLAFYANNFLAPVNQTYYTNLDPSNNIVDPTYGNIHVVYNAFRISQFFFYGGHDGLDVVYRPPIGNEQTDISRDLAVYVPYQGVVVEAGPDSLTYTNILYGAYDNLPSWIKDACAAMDPGDGAGETCKPTNSYFFQVYRHPDGITATVTIALNYDGDPSSITTFKTDGLNSGGDPVPTLTFNQFREIAENSSFTLDCEFTVGCSIGGGRQLIIWHEAGDGDVTPDIATLYYHITMQQYDTWQQNCSTKAYPRLDIWQTAINDPNHQCWVYVSTSQEPEKGFIGRAQQIGFSTGMHLHYGVAVDRDSPIDDDANGNMFTTQGSTDAPLNPNEEIDPSIAVDLHMPPGKGGTGHSD